ncbi:hypothetical protein BX616_001481 [Lobosporangium transversale]|uniref:Uncharacterized protein n=1 Tax=Lobosporangium transversale TaxID=64571 RepID=A0A1Y2GT70_9FUNG|nr:hypothetical protein BCR41DRAFT_395186 [Lobosporangium transversale]KAF9903934.1 hypothetical protein BX616_001481 [Lobosporangium transversale]ORZ20178.1 hypothetical protein BCR41DRAFT_395186 [Lobosporangium transversale]|eukprot:XP_021882718.1 hypothetical protein BCR41DRAFT_395186 [Lobosporangium transversale]
MSSQSTDLNPATQTLITTFTTTVKGATSSIIAAATTTATTATTTESATLVKQNLLCDWTRTAANCRDAEFIRYMLWASCAMHIAVGFFGVWLLIYRNRGFNRKIVTDLFLPVGTGIRPKPMDCLIFFMTISCPVKVAGNLLLIFDVLQDAYWLRIAVEQLYWVFIAIAFSAYFVGLLYAMPITTRQGIFAVYQPEVAYGARALRPIHVLTPSTVQKNILLIMGAVYPSLFGAGIGIASGALRDQGNEEASHTLLLIQYANWSLILYIMAFMFFYYGLKYTFILRANIIIAEKALKAPRAAFGIGNIRSRSPARFLFIQLQITGFGGCAVTVLAGTLCLFWVLFQDKILEMENDQLPHTIAFFWTCAMAVTYLVAMSLVTVQSIRTRRRGMQEPSSNVSNPSNSRNGPSSRQGSGGSEPTVQSSGTGGGRAGSLKKERLDQNFTSKGSMKSDSEACLTYGDSEDANAHHPNMGFDRYPVESFDLEGAAATAIESDRDSYRAPSLTPPPRHLSINTNSANGNDPASKTYIINIGPAPSQIRESVFGGRTPREETSTSSLSPPLSPTSGGFNIPSFPLAIIRPKSRNSTHPRPSISSVTSSGSPSHHTTSTTTLGSSNRLSRNSSFKNSGPVSVNPPKSPTHQGIRRPSNIEQQPHTPTSPAPVYAPREQHSRIERRFSNTIREQSSSDIHPIASTSAPSSPSRGGGGGYRSHEIGLESIQSYAMQQQQEPPASAYMRSSDLDV